MKHLFTSSTKMCFIFNLTELLWSYPCTGLDRPRVPENWGFQDF